ncbi:helix-turn-helix domain-containing protein [Rhodoblastus acidophilus]|jgi:transcriptional regulator with XRE-family HTH domain|uniref:Helix-turn-helix domain-containing protein n=1 Tax=Rhodoblastus acidophilus TaxID=1074 RepID=A0A6N8DQE5_RHOAC|nr:transcriptional regulator with XRE-family HTH domain [Rhodoblastus acidophilus]MTV32689.1 helix-turn-helix domain-containing protein [Rhodoblastus acidophilus]
MAQIVTGLFGIQTSTPAPNPIDAHVGARVRRLRLVSRVRLEALAETIGVTIFEMRNYERGDSRISAENLRRICHALQAPPSFFFESGSVRSGRRGAFCG